MQWRVSDKLWAKLESLLEDPPRRFRYPGRARYSARACLEGILYVLYTDTPWLQVPYRELGLPSGETCRRRLEEWEREGRHGDRLDILIASTKQVGPAIFASLLVIAIAFMPVFTLEAQEGRLFKPLAFTKSLAIAMSAVLAITLIPAVLPLLVRGRIIAEQRHPVSWLLQRLYAPILRLALRLRWIGA